MWEAVTVLINKLEPVHIMAIIFIGGREWMIFQERKLFADALSKLIESMNGVRVMIAAITGKAQ